MAVAPKPSPPPELGERVRSAHWYHTLELPGGIVTPGEYDLRPALARVPLPASLAGMRCLDVGTRDGFWAFEMERRGAAEVVAVDLDDPRRLDWPDPPHDVAELSTALEARERGFAIAQDALGSSVVRRDLSVYDLSPAEVGEFDLAFVGTLLLHLRDPVGALAALRRVVRGTLMLNEAISLQNTLLSPRRPRAILMARGAPFWWVPNLAALKRAVQAAGFVLERVGRPYLLPTGAGGVPYTISPFSDYGPPLLDLVLSRRGIPSAWIVARPLEQG